MAVGENERMNKRTNVRTRKRWSLFQLFPLALAPLTLEDALAALRVPATTRNLSDFAKALCVHVRAPKYILFRFLLFSVFSYHSIA